MMMLMVAGVPEMVMMPMLVAVVGVQMIGGQFALRLGCIVVGHDQFGSRRLPAALIEGGSGSGGGGSHTRRLAVDEDLGITGAARRESVLLLLAMRKESVNTGGGAKRRP